ncbi:hypothetical protein B0H19DRAFT_1075781 [Mycena capillaripes]|nr:hypothetical protein B0H19DRAFT_1075781 [Mycena capillaripes]
MTSNLSMQYAVHASCRINSITAFAIRVTLADVCQSLTRITLHVSSDGIEAGGSTLSEPLDLAVRTPPLLTPLLVPIEGISSQPPGVCNQLMAPRSKGRNRAAAFRVAADFSVARGEFGSESDVLQAIRWAVGTFGIGWWNGQDAVLNQNRRILIRRLFMLRIQFPPD